MSTNLTKSEGDRLSKGLTVHKADPLNAEPPIGVLIERYITPEGRFYARCHGEIPAVDPSAYRLRVEGQVGEPLELSLDDLRERFEHRTVVATLQCAGLRRDELDDLEHIDGVRWEAGAISNARWTGASLAEVLREAGIAADNDDLYVVFAGLDEVEVDDKQTHFGASISMSKALSDEVILAWAMNDAPLTPVHGAPIRVIVPGYIGARSVKWLRTIRVQDEPSHNHFQRYVYKLLPADADPATAPASAGVPLAELPVNSVICVPQEGAVLPPGPVAVRGYAVVGGGRHIKCVEVSTDGERWTAATLDDGAHEPWTWTLWWADLDLAPGRHTLQVRARAGGTQPKDPADIWNPKGYVNNAWHRISVTAQRG